MTPVAMTATGFTVIFAATSLGSALVLFFKKDISPKVNTAFLGFASGVMIAASVWSLIIPSIEASETVGFVIGGFFLVLLDHAVPHLHRGTACEEGPHTKRLKKSAKMFLAVTIHNIPEGLAVGFAFGAAAGGEQGGYIAALALAIGMAIQNLPEGAAVSLPMKYETGSRWKAFAYGVGSGAVEPLFAVVGYFLAASVSVLQPWLLAFAAGAMIFVVIEDLIPDARLETHPHLILISELGVRWRVSWL